MTSGDAVLGVGFGSWSVRVQGPGADLAWLIEFVHPWLTATESAAYRVRLVRDAARRAAAQGAEGVCVSIAAFELDRETVRLEARRASDGSIVAADTAYGVAYVVAADRSLIEVLAGDRHRSARTALMRVVREGVMIHARRSGQLLLHAAAVTGKNGCVVLPGRKNSGKTSLLIHLLRGTGTAFLSNDRVAISAAGETLVARGIPTVIGMDAGAERLFPTVAEMLRARGSDHRRRADEPPASAPGRLVVSPRQLCDALGVEVEATGTVRAIVFPAISPAVRGVRLRRLGQTAALARLDESRLGAPPFAASELFAPPRSAAGVADTTAILARLAREVPCFDGLLGPDAYRSEGALTELFQRAEAAT